MAVLDSNSALSTYNRLEVKRLFWMWYHQNQDAVVLKRWFFSIRVKDLHSLFVRLFGEEG